MTSLNYSSCGKVFLERERGRTWRYRESMAMGGPGIRLFGYPKQCFDVGVSGSGLIQHRIIHPISAGSSSPSSSSPHTQMHLPDEETPIEETSESKTVHVKFQLQKQCSFGQQFLIVGDDLKFGLWDPSKALPMIWSDGHVWTVELELPIGKSFKYKFILRGFRDDYVLWQPGPDRILETWETTNTIIVCEDWENCEIRMMFEEKSPEKVDPMVENSPEMVVPMEEKPTVDMALVPGLNPLPKTDPMVEKPIADTAMAALVPGLNPLPKTDPMVEKPIADTAMAALVPGLNPLPKTDPMAEKPIADTAAAVLVPGLNPLPKTDNSDKDEVVIDEYHEQTKLQSISEEEQESKTPETANLAEEDRPNTKQIISNEEEEEEEEHEWNKPEIVNRPNTKKIIDGAFKNDIHWGRRTLQKFLTNLGFL